jgi:hypothetical protein
MSFITIVALIAEPIERRRDESWKKRKSMLNRFPPFSFYGNLPVA